VTAIGADPDDTCANCGGPGDAVSAVRRVYVTVDDQGRVTGSETMSEPERWCVSCRSLYPHLACPDGAGPGTDPGTPGSGDPPTEARSS
jgi:hypothetical protein